MVDAVRVLLVTGGHPFEKEPFFEIFDANTKISWQQLPHPEAQEMFGPEALTEFDAVVFYDMPGIEFTRSDPPARFTDPEPGYVKGFEAVLEFGIGLVFLHHAIAGWPTWSRYADIVGGRFHYQPAELAGLTYPDSGYRHEVTHTVELLDPDHPVSAGLPITFEITDEVYLFPVFEDSVVPLMRSRHSFSDKEFFSADLAIRGRRDCSEGWSHPPGSDLVAWVKNAGNSPVTYIQFGDGPDTYADPNYQRLVANAISWVASDQAHSWARDRQLSPEEPS
ncbi:MAG: ThuA domain-containing protein [Actinomycetota bacterium]|nr:ThuA domain-containing protein [Actinomycetota bacterium]